MSNSTEILAERDRVLAALDTIEAREFIRKTGGKVPGGNLDWFKILHLARLECFGDAITDEMRTDSRIYLAMHGAESIGTLSHRSPYLSAAMEILFPAVVWQETAAKMGWPS